MKLIICDGRELEVRDVGPVIYRLAAGAVPIKVNGHLLLEDEDARDLLRDLVQVQRLPAVEDAAADNYSAQGRKTI